jgi:hypothetical protein
LLNDNFELPDWIIRMPTATLANQVNLVIATPCYGGQVSVLYAASLFKLQQMIRS